MKATLRVYCEERSHEERRVIVTTFIRGLGGDDEWMEIPGRSVRARKSMNLRAILDREEEPPPIDKPTTGQIVTSDDAVDYGVRTRYRLSCRLCGLTVPARRERLLPILDRLADAGVDAVSLSGVAATLSKH